MTTDMPPEVMTETPEARKARKLLQLDAVLEAMDTETRPLSKAFYHGWILSAAMELWDSAILTREERLGIEERANNIANGDVTGAPEPEASADPQQPA